VKAKIKNTGRGVAHVTHSQKREEILPATASLLVIGSKWRDRSNGLVVRVTRVYDHNVSYIATGGLFCGSFKPRVFLTNFEPTKKAKRGAK